MKDAIEIYKEKMYEIYNIKKELSSMTESIEEKNKRLKQELSDCDLKISDIYHYVEFGKFNAVEEWKLLSKLRDVLKERRIIKNKYEETQCILNTSFNKRAESLVNLSEKQKKYNPRTDIIEDTLNKKFI